eukprot:TRINITY_DN2760_c2_g2_i1.p1 TRINITY_DN2760_c2_g2~~TRINITY_DN2760_c2_g2_i1.p1  ORF type:complete len:702 (+),score=153.16 TRINITY_DN2760_c2_g2_i1:85-2190(+)
MLHPSLSGPQGHRVGATPQAAGGAPRAAEPSAAPAAGRPPTASQVRSKSSGAPAAPLPAAAGRPPPAPASAQRSRTAGLGVSVRTEAEGVPRPSVEGSDAGGTRLGTLLVGVLLGAALVQLVSTLRSAPEASGPAAAPRPSAGQPPAFWLIQRRGAAPSATLTPLAPRPPAPAAAAGPAAGAPAPPSRAEPAPQPRRGGGVVGSAIGVTAAAVGQIAATTAAAVAAAGSAVQDVGSLAAAAASGAPVPQRLWAPPPEPGPGSGGSGPPLLPPGPPVFEDRLAADIDYLRRNGREPPGSEWADDYEEHDVLGGDGQPKCRLPKRFLRNIDDELRPWCGKTITNGDILRQGAKRYMMVARVMPEGRSITSVGGSVGMDWWQFAPWMHSVRRVLSRDWLKGVADFHIAVNGADEPRQHKQCDGPAHQSCMKRARFHGFGADHLDCSRPRCPPSVGGCPEPGLPTAPIFSPGAAPGCFSDLLFPSVAGWQATPVIKGPWEKKKKVVFWRGSTTGFGFPSGQSHRLRLVKAARALAEPQLAGSTASAGFTAFVQDCAGAACSEARSLKADSVPFQTMAEYRYVLDIDGNTYSRRMAQLLRYNSTVFRAAYYHDVFSKALSPWIHYVPFRMDTTDLGEAVRTVASDDGLAARIAVAGVNFSAHWLDEPFTDCYTLAVLRRYSECVRTEPLPQMSSFKSVFSNYRRRR